MAQDANRKCGPKDRRPVGPRRGGAGPSLGATRPAASVSRLCPPRTGSGGPARRCAGRGARGLGPQATAGVGSAGSAACGAAWPGHCGPSLRCHHGGRGASAGLHPMGGGGRAGHRARRRRRRTRRRPEAASSPLRQPLEAAGAPDSTGLTPHGHREPTSSSPCYAGLTKRETVSRLGLQITKCHWGPLIRSFAAYSPNTGN